jgi:hypothetical protein
MATMQRRRCATIGREEKILAGAEVEQNSIFFENRAGRLSDLIRQHRAMKMEITNATRPVYCVDSALWYPSCRAAADWISDLTGHVVRRNRIRTAIVRKCLIHGYTFTYNGPRESRPRSQVIPSSYAIPVRCVTTGKKFKSVSMAARFAGTTDTTFFRRVRSGRPVNGRIFELARQTVDE